MEFFNALILKFKHPDWSRNPEFGLVDSILEEYPELILLLKNDITRGLRSSNFGRKDTPTVEQIVRAAIFKEIKGYDYRELEYAQSDSRICAAFLKLDDREPFCFQVFQKYISKIQAKSLSKLLVEINRIAIKNGYEDLSKVRQDSTVVLSNIHHPTNNSLVWDCIRKSTDLLYQLKEEIETLAFMDYTTGAKKTFFKINTTKTGDKKVDLFRKQLITLTKTINQTSNIIKKKYICSIRGMAILMQLEQLLPLMEQVYDMTKRKEILGESVPNDQKIFSIFELHTDIIVKGSREALFGHKVNLATGKSNLVLDCDILRGNPSDSTLYQPTINRVVDNYGIIPRDSTADGGFASKANMDYSRSKGIVNVVFNKIVGSLKNISSSLNIQSRLKKWRSGIEAVISNLKRGFNIHRCNWKGWEHFQTKVLWSVLAYNFRVMTNMTLEMILKKA
jgi:IS5 family transposase